MQRRKSRSGFNPNISEPANWCPAAERRAFLVTFLALEKSDSHASVAVRNAFDFELF